jgi:hypothetical protein
LWTALGITLGAVTIAATWACREWLPINLDHLNDIFGDTE